MTALIDKVLRSAKNLKKYNILCVPTHEAYETGLAKTGHNFYALDRGIYPQFNLKFWNTNYRPRPDNYQIIKTKEFPISVGFDFVLSQNKCGQYQLLSQLAHQYNLPLISLEHTLPVPNNQRMLIEYGNMRGDFNVFISEYSMEKWGFDSLNEDTWVIHHGIDTETFKPAEVEKDGAVLSVVNDWVNRDWCCNFSGWNRTVKGLKVRVVGDTPGLSLPATNLEELVSAYQSCSVFYNTSTISPVPTALMEAMSCGAACVSTATCMIPEIIKNGYNGFISNDESELRKYLELLLNDRDLAEEMGANARKTIETNFNQNQFINRWNMLFEDTYNTIYGVEK